MTKFHYFQIRFVQNILISFIFVIIFFVILYLSGCAAFTYQKDNEPQLTYQVITPGASQLHTSIIEGTHTVAERVLLSPLPPFAYEGSSTIYMNIIAIDETKIVDYKNIEAEHFISKKHFKTKTSVTTYRTEVSPGLHSLLAIRCIKNKCSIAELDFTIEPDRRYIITPSEIIGVDLYILVEESLEKTKFNESTNIYPAYESIEICRDNFISRNKKKKSK